LCSQVGQTLPACQKRSAINWGSCTATQEKKSKTEKKVECLGQKHPFAILLALCCPDELGGWQPKTCVCVYVVAA